MEASDFDQLALEDRRQGFIAVKVSGGDVTFNR